MCRSLPKNGPTGPPRTIDLEKTADICATIYLWKDSRHESHIRMDGDIINNQMESFNGNTLRFREKVTRGLKSEDSAILASLQVYHNHVRPHLALEGGTPGKPPGYASRATRGCR